MDNTAPKADQDAGFTLIELLVVMIIIGILAAIAVPTFLNQRKNAIGAGQVADLRSVADEVEGFYVNNEEYPSTFVQAGEQITITSSLGTGAQRVTVGNAMTYTPNNATPASATAYCLVAHNTKAAGDRVWVSNSGGIQPPTITTCPASF
jgi:prepilin-type N-terminal cleavage/methylation domain-containing protein